MMTPSQLRNLVSIIAVSLVIGLSAYQSAWGAINEARGKRERGDYSTELKVWRPLAEQGDAEAQYNLGVMYERGLGVSRDYIKSVKWYRKAAEQGYAKAESSLGQRYYYGEGVPQNNREAVKWFRKAAEQGHATGQLRLGVMYRQGRSVLKDHVMAYMWWIIASENGDKDSIVLRGLAEKVISRSEIREATRLSREWLKKNPK